MITAALARQIARKCNRFTANRMGVLPAQQPTGQPHLSACQAAMSTSAESWDRVLDVLSGLIKNIKRADGKNWRDAHANMPVYLRRLGIEDAVQQLSVIHVAGTKGKGSTCAMVESILRSAGYSTGLFTSPHLCDVRERVRINGKMVSQAVFADAFWRCYNTLQAAVTDDVGMPGYFRFLTLLGLQIFLDTTPDVVILEVGIGGRIDATNILKAPAVTGITSLGFDHMELLGDTLDKIAAEKAGIMRQGVPCFTVPQPEDAMGALQACAAAVGADLHAVPPLSNFTSQQPLSVGLAGDHQLLNASLAVAMVQAWEQQRLNSSSSSGSTGIQGGAAAVIEGPNDSQQQQQQQQGLAGAPARLGQLQQGVLPDEYCEGLGRARWPGRSQVVAHPGFRHAGSSNCSRLTVYLDGAHTPESMVTCAIWFAHATQQQQQTAANGISSSKEPKRMRILVFNCMKERDPGVLLPQLHSELQRQDAAIDMALFVPPDSQYAFLPSSSKQALVAAAHQDLSWQQQLQGVWQQCNAPAAAETAGRASHFLLPALPQVGGISCQDVAQGSAVLSSVGQALGWVEDAATATPDVHFDVLVTGSLYLVGDCLVALQQQPS